MSTNRNQKAFIRIDGSGRDVAGSLILRNKKPGNGKWREVLAYECCNTTPVNPLAVGTFYSGGIIASSTIIEGQVMIVDLNDLDLTLWSNNLVFTGATGTALKTGESNTNTIISSQGPGSYAAIVCRNSGIFNGDLPSKDELNEIFVNLTAINTGIADNGGTIIGTDEYCYWSSTEISSNAVWTQCALNDQLSDTKTDGGFLTRAVKWVSTTPSPSPTTTTTTTL